MKELKLIKAFYKCYSINVSRDEIYLITFGGNQIKIYMLDTFELIKIFNDIKNPGNIIFSRSNFDLFLAQSTKNDIGIFSLKNLTLEKKLSCKSKDTQNCTSLFSPDNLCIVSGIYKGINNTISTIDVNSGKIETHLNLENSFVRFIEYCSNDILLFSIFDRSGIENEQIPKSYLLKWKYPFEEKKPETIKSNLVSEWDYIKISYDNNKFAFYMTVYDQKYTGKLIITDKTLNNKILEYTITNSEGYFCGLNWSYDDRYIALTFSNKIQIIKVEECRCIRTIEVEYAMTSNFTRNEKYFTIGTMNRGYIFELEEVLTEQ